MDIRIFICWSAIFCICILSWEYVMCFRWWPLQSHIGIATSLTLMTKLQVPLIIDFIVSVFTETVIMHVPNWCKSLKQNIHMQSHCTHSYHSFCKAAGCWCTINMCLYWKEWCILCGHCPRTTTVHQFAASKNHDNIWFILF